MRARSVSLVFVFSLVASGCTQSPQSGVPVGPGGEKIVFTGDQKADWGQIVALENQAKVIAKADGCSSASQCRTAPVGARACGGPRYYIVYCAQSTDSAALFRKLDAVATAEREYNQRYNLVSTCEFRMPPNVGVVAGSCLQQAPPILQVP
ncbi:MAG TPA: hypothetical protein VK575_02075 [Gemmatimonadaceae bacterium]|jgi:hypothetical protein|nr:hypothetical protein [Gemmatimonadaceae bacterium]